MPLPDDIAARISRGNEFQKRFITWFVNGDMLGPDGEILHASFPSLDSLVIPKSSPKGRVGRGRQVPIPPDPTRTRDGVNVTGRPDVVAIVDDGSERSVIIIELKSTDWSTMTPVRLRRNVAAHAAQVYSYQGHWTNQLWDPTLGDRGGWRTDLDFQAVQMYLCYETRPADPAVADAIVEQVGEGGISVVWFDEIEAEHSPN